MVVETLAVVIVVVASPILHITASKKASLQQQVIFSKNVPGCKSLGRVIPLDPVLQSRVETEVGHPSVPSLACGKVTNEMLISLVFSGIYMADIIG